MFLVRADLLEILRADATDVVVPEPVFVELCSHGEDDPTVEAIRRVDWLRMTPSPNIPSEIAAWDLGPGESAVLALALAEPERLVVIDDLEARRCAHAFSIPVIGTLGLLILAKQESRIPAVRPLVDRLRESGMYLSDRVINQALARVGE